MQRATAYAVHIEAACAVPAFEIKSTVYFPTRLIQAPEPSGEFVSMNQYPLRVLQQDLRDLLHSSVLGLVTSQYRLFWQLNVLQLASQLVQLRLVPILGCLFQIFLKRVLLSLGDQHVCFVC